MKNVVLVCGGRYYGVVPPHTPKTELPKAKAKAKRERQIMFDTLDMFNNHTPITLLVQGWAKGADQLAHEWALERNVPSTGSKHQVTHSMWNKLGKSAGFIRNKNMRDEERPHIVLAFPGGNG